MVKKKEKNTINDLASEIEGLGAKLAQSIDDFVPPYFVSTGLVALDQIISSGRGIPARSCVEIYGPQGTGKTSLAIKLLANAKAMGKVPIYINAERAINDDYLKAIDGINPDDVMWITPDNGEAALNVIIHLLRTQKDLVIINDSIPACLPAKIEEGDIGDAHVGVLARMFTSFMPKAKKFCELNNSVLIQLNQERAKIGPMARGGKEQPGGNAIKFYSDIRIELARRFPNPEIKSGGTQIGHYVKAKMVKSRHSLPYQVAEMPLIYGKGFDAAREMFDFAASLGIIKQKGAYFYYYENDTDEEPKYKSQGAEGIIQQIRDDDALRQHIKSKVSVTLTTEDGDE